MEVSLRAILACLLLAGCERTVPIDCSGFAWYEDVDGDGWGVGEPARVCTAPVGWTDRRGDCDDRDPRRRPDAIEVCDPEDVDEDCDYAADDADTQAEGKRDWILDTDGDGYAPWGERAIEACERPLGYVEPRGDCDDADPTTHPHAVEICADGIDQDCDGGAGPCGIQGEMHRPDGEPAFPATITSIGDVNGDGVVDATTKDGRIFLGPQPRYRVTPAEPWARAERMDARDAFLADLDGDGLDDLVVSGGEPPHEVRVWRGLRAGRLALDEADLVVSGAYALGPPSDTDGDGAAELLLALDAERVWVADGRARGVVGLADVALAQIEGGRRLVGVGDLDGDGRGDLAWSTATGVAVALGPVRGAYDEATADLVLSGEPDAPGWPEVVSVGDVDGDGLAELGILDHGTLRLLTDPLTAMGLGDGDVLDTGCRGVSAVGSPDGSGRVMLLIGHDHGSWETNFVSRLIAFDGVGWDDVAWLELEAPRALGGADADGDGYDDVWLDRWLLFGGPGM